MNQIIVFDFEVFEYNTLFGAYLIHDNGFEVYQTWDLSEIKEFYENHKNDIWVGHNIAGYDNYILQDVVSGFSEQRIKATNDNIILNGIKPWLRIQLYYYDLMTNHVCQLKAVEAFEGKNISETEIDFNIKRELTTEEKKQVEHYNRDDLNQTLEDFYAIQDEFLLRLDIISEFNLPMSSLSITGTQLAEQVLHAEKIQGVENNRVAPIIWPNLRVKNQRVIDFYLKESWRREETLICTLCGTEHKLAAGGIHGCKKHYSCKSALYFDVSGYYNLIMINLGLLPRSIPSEYQQLYKKMYQDQLLLKKTNPQKRQVYKTILLSVFGAMNNEYCKFYDPYHGDLVRLSGEMFLVDLLEKLEGKIEVIQSNTDGVIAEPLNNTTEQEIINVINEWQNRTGFVLKIEKIYDIYQRDVNCYMYRDSNGIIHTRGDIIKHYGMINTPFKENSFKSKEPLIIASGVCEFFLNGKEPEQVVFENKNDLRLFQYICRRQSFDYMQYDEVDIYKGIHRIETLQNVNRAFALKSNHIKGMIYKCKWDGKKSKVPNLPLSVFIYNKEILSENTINELQKRIDYDYYVTRIQEKILEFVGESI